LSALTRLKKAGLRRLQSASALEYSKEFWVKLVNLEDVVSHVIIVLRDVENINLVRCVMKIAERVKNFVLIALNHVIIQSPREQANQRIIPYSTMRRVSRR
jgi:hypothetical protein